MSDVRFLTNRYEAADNYLWEITDGIGNVIAIFGDADDCKLAASAMNAAALSALDTKPTDRTAGWTALTGEPGTKPR